MCTMVDQEIKPRFGRILLELFQESYANSKVAFKTLANCKKICLQKTLLFSLFEVFWVFCKHLFRKRLPFEGFPIWRSGCFFGTFNHRNETWKVSKTFGVTCPPGQGMLVTTRSMILRDLQRSTWYLCKPWSMTSSFQVHESLRAMLGARTTGTLHPTNGRQTSPCLLASRVATAESLTQV